MHVNCVMILTKSINKVSVTKPKNPPVNHPLLGGLVRRITILSTYSLNAWLIGFKGLNTNVCDQCASMCGM